MSKIDKKKKIVIGSIVGVILVGVIIFATWFFNRKFNISFDLGNGTKVSTVMVKYNKTIDEKNIKGKKELGDSFVNWYEIIEVKDGKEVLAKEPFDFKNKINKDVKLKAVYTSENETITITFDSKGGSKVKAITINLGTELILPKNPTYKGYTFKGWEDKNGTPIYEKALLSEDTTLYARWEKVEEKKTTSKKTTTKATTKKTTTTTTTKKILSYYCDNGYKLVVDKCVKVYTTNIKVTYSCGDVYTKLVGNKCVNPSDRTERIETCPNNGVVGKGHNACYYNDIGPSTGSIDKYTCDQMNGHYYNGHCYRTMVQGKDANITLSCPSGYTLFTPEHSNPTCGKSIDATASYSCPSGYKRFNGKCNKPVIVDAKKR